MEIERLHETYLGDGAYVYLDRMDAVVLYTSDGIRETNRVVLEPKVLFTLVQWLRQHKEKEIWA